MPRALVVDDDETSLFAVAAFVEKNGFSTHTAADLGPARLELDSHTFDLVILDVMLPNGSGIDLLLSAAQENQPAVILISGDDSIRALLGNVPMKSLNFMQKPIDFESLGEIVREVRRACRQPAERRRAAEGRVGTDRLIGDSAPIARVRELIVKVANTDFPVYIEGESGTGKELVARAIHEVSARADGPFVAINCGAIPETLIDSELFGHEKGAFTGAKDSKPGVFEQAEGGTLFLDEIAEMPVELQVRLLRTLETSTVKRVGARGDRTVDVRIVSATNRRFDVAIREGKFREDLFYRLCVFPIAMPQLRQRPDDVQTLANFFLAQLEASEGKSKPLADDTMKLLISYSWPGNVRQLRNAIQRAYVLAEDVITPECLPPQLHLGARGQLPTTFVSEAGDQIRIDVGTSIAVAERHLIEATLRQHDGNKRAAAEILGVSLRTLYNRLSEYESGEASQDDGDRRGGIRADEVDEVNDGASVD